MLCSPRHSAELIAVTVSNSGPESLANYPVEIALDANNFDFTVPDVGGRNLAAWDAATRRPLNYWLESYDAAEQRALLWVKLPSLASQGTRTVWLTADGGECAARHGSGYDVFPFFSDARDVRGWQQTDPSLRLSNKETLGPLLVESRQTIESDGLYNAFPNIAEAGNGDWVLSYGKGTGHVRINEWVERSSHDHGLTWSPEFPTISISALARTPSGDLLAATEARDANGTTGAAYARSGDHGLTWGPPTLFDDPASDAILFRKYVLYANGSTKGQRT